MLKWTLSEADRRPGFVSTTRPDGSVHSSLVTAGFMDHPVTGNGVVAFVVFGNAHRLAFFRSAGRASIVFRANYRWAGIEGPVDLIVPDDPFAGFDDAQLPQPCGTSSAPLVAATTTGTSTTG